MKLVTESDNNYWISDCIKTGKLKKILFKKMI